VVLFFRNQTEKQQSSNKEELIKILIPLLVLLAFSFFYLSALKSLSKVIRAGGSGWEGVNYKEIKKRQMMLQQSAPSTTVPQDEL
jgi:hypothetical protein